MAQTPTCQRSGRPTIHNATDLDTERLTHICLQATATWRLGGAVVRVRYSRGADFSGSCYYGSGRIFVNIGRHVVYPYRMGTHIARTRSNARHWWKPIYTIELNDAYQLALFVFLHECFHLLVKRARRNPRQKESMCDRFAARILVDAYVTAVHDEEGHPVPRTDWDFQDVEQFIAAARRKRPLAVPALAPPPGQPPATGAQLLLFPL